MNKEEFVAYTKEKFPNVNANLEYYMYERIVKQAAHDAHISLPKGLKMLILSDRCPGRAFGLQEYLIERTDASEVLLLHEYNSVRSALETWVPDILIFVGYQKNNLNFRARALVLSKNPSALVIMYASLDRLIEQLCITHNIHYSYSSHEPVADFANYISAIYAKKTAGKQDQPNI